MRVLHVVHQYPPDHVGGVELYTRAMARRQASDGHSVAVFCPETGFGDTRQPIDEGGVRVYRVNNDRRGRGTVFLSTLGHTHLTAAFDDVLARERPDIVHLQHLMGLPAAVAESVSTAGIPYVITLHDYWYGCANAQLLTNYDGTVCGGPNGWFTNCGRCALARAGVGTLAPMAPLVAPLMAWRNRALRRVFEGADRVLASTQFVRRAHEAMGFPAERISLLPLGADVTNEGRAAALEARRRLKSDENFHIGYIGGLSYQKGVHHLIAAVNILPKHAALSIFGDMSAYPDYVTILRQAAAHPGIRFMGILDRSDFWPTLGALDVLVLPTMWYETYGLVVQEAFAAGVPVVASRIGVMPEVIEEGVSGRLFTPGDADSLSRILLELMEHPDRVEALRAGVPTVMTMDHHAERLEAIYRDVSADVKPTNTHR